MKKKKKEKVTGKITTILAITAFAASFIGFTYLNLTQLNESNPARSEPLIAPIEAGILPELVCMVNDTYMGKKQIPVPIDNKTYYGCCEACVGKLQSNQTFRLAQDPTTGDTVDKSQAYIVLSPSDDHQVLYFTAKATFGQYQQPSE
ncbi:MAG: hypothetical protein RIG62_27230 [Cyclobacteriaceae bacterium]